MTDQFRRAAFPCPACPKDAPLREHEGRLLCDTCEGIFVTSSDLVRALEQLAGMEAKLELLEVKPGERKCPRCEATMTTCRLRLEFPVIEEDPKTKPTLDHCDTDGFWFDRDELASVFEVTLRATGRKGAPSGGNVLGNMRPGAGRGWGFGT